MKALLYLFGLLPSFIWLLFYLRHDKHPEPNKMVLFVFLSGILAGFSAIVLEKLFQYFFMLLSQKALRESILAIFIGGAFIEEVLKFLAVKMVVFRNKELDEPIDLVLYLVISALGFAALENILVLANNHPVLTTGSTIEMMAIRFISATFLHALTSGLLGYFIAKGFFHTKRKWLYFVVGLLGAVILHGAYNWAIITLKGTAQFIIPFSIIIFLIVVVSVGVKKLKNKTGACLIK